jgi:hypothetical protein
MATQRTPAGLPRPQVGDRDWDVPILELIDALDALHAYRNLIVLPAEQPSASLDVRVFAGRFRNAAGAMVAYAGAARFALPASSAVYVYLTDVGALAQSAALPAGNVVVLAVVTTGPAAVLTIEDRRFVPRSGTA